MHIPVDLYRLIAPFTRCTRCNGKLEKTEKQEIEHRLEPLTKKHYDNFLICFECRQIYWQGSHYAHAKRLVDEFSDRYSSANCNAFSIIREPK
ncbi:MAG: hypothetical protein KAR12_13625 [Methylococcales bacterium]|nr:hypothetical protein [Methylococcales bacterium]